MTRAPRPLPSALEWVQACGLVKRGREWCGPCPLCGGHDRFHVREGAARALIGCRGCLDGLPADTRQRRFGELVAAVFSDRVRAAREGVHRRAPQPSAPQPSASGSAKARTPARRIWNAAAQADGTPARAYLAGRMAWPPDGIGPDLPVSVRWLPRERAPAPDKAARWHGLPGDAAGAILYAFGARDTGARRFNASMRARRVVRAVSMEALDSDGKRLAPRWRRTIGERKGALFAVAPIGEASAVAAIAEGEVSALACAWLHPGAVAYGCGGTAGLASVALPDLAPDARAVIEADGDRSGDAAARTARDRLAAAGVAVHVEWRTTGDAADELAGMIGERAAILAEGGMTDAEALAEAWRDMLPAHGPDRNSAPAELGADGIVPRASPIAPGPGENPCAERMAGICRIRSATRASGAARAPRRARR